MQLSQNQNILSKNFYAFLESKSNLKYLEKEDELQRWFPSEIIDWKMRVYFNA